jgi:hypothetical protein
MGRRTCRADIADCWVGPDLSIDRFYEGRHRDVVVGTRTVVDSWKRVQIISGKLTDNSQNSRPNIIGWVTWRAIIRFQRGLSFCNIAIRQMEALEVYGKVTVGIKVYFGLRCRFLCYKLHFVM